MMEEQDSRAVANIAAEVSPESTRHADAEHDTDGEGAAQAFDVDARVLDLERRIRELEAAIGDLRTVSAHAAPAQGASSTLTGRRTRSTVAPGLRAKGVETRRPESVDAALGCLSVEQRLAVKAGLLRVGLL